MKHSFYQLLIVFSGGLFISDLYGATATAVGTETVTIDRECSISQTQGLKFGDISFAGDGGTVSVSNAGVTSSTGNAQIDSGAQKGIFTVSCSPNTSLNVTMENIPTQLVLSSDNSKHLTVNSLNLSSNSVSLGNSEYSKTVSTGGTLSIASDSEPGSYSGSYGVRIAFP